MEEIHAAVALILNKKNEILLIKRKESLNDPWSGDYALPGGKKEEGEELIQTAIREVKEEVGIDLSKAKYLGSLRFVRSIRFPELKVKPFIFKLENEVELAKGEEVAEILWLPIFDLKRKKVKIEKINKFRYAFIYKQAIIWGITYRIISIFLREFRNPNEGLIQ